MTENEIQAAYRKFWQLNPIEDEQAGYPEFHYLTFGTVEKDREGTIITADYLIQKYSEYLQYMKQFDRGQYTKRIHQPLLPSAWLDQKAWNKELFDKADPNDFYLYGIE